MSNHLFKEDFYYKNDLYIRVEDTYSTNELVAIDIYTYRAGELNIVRYKYVDTKEWSTTPLQLTSTDIKVLQKGVDLWLENDMGLSLEEYLKAMEL